VQCEPTLPTLDHLTAAAGIIAGVKQENETWHRLAADLFVASVKAVNQGAVKEDAKVTLMGVPLKSGKLRAAAELHLMVCASHTSGEEHDKLIVEALQVAPFRLV
jgi:hypothetical protein